MNVELIVDSTVDVPEHIKDAYWKYMKTTGEYLLSMAK